MPPSAPTSRLERRLVQLGGRSTKTILMAVGDAVRRPDEPTSARPEETERALSALSLAEVCEAIASADVAGCAAKLSRAGDDAFEAAFAEGEEDRALFASASLDGLAARDQLESLRTAALRFVEIARDGGSDVGALGGAVDALDRGLAELDAGRAALCRKLTGVNAERRAELGRLAPELRERAWWYEARSADDALLSVLAGGEERADLSDAVRADVVRSSGALAAGAGRPA